MISEASETELATGQKRRPSHLGLDQAVLINARDGDVEDLALGEVPRRMQAHRKPKAAGQHVGTSEQQPGLNRNRKGGKPGRVGVHDVGETQTAPK